MQTRFCRVRFGLSSAFFSFEHHISLLNTSTISRSGSSARDINRTRSAPHMSRVCKMQELRRAKTKLSPELAAAVRGTEVNGVNGRLLGLTLLRCGT
jgi:hypothetical protein